MSLHNSEQIASSLQNLKLFGVESQKMTDFLDELLFQHNYYPSVAFIDMKVNIIKTLSELTYLISTKPNLALALLNKKNVPGSIENINYYYRQALKKIHNQIKETYIDVSMAKAKHMTIPIAISQILIPPVGTMLSALIPSIIEEFVNEDNPYSHSLKGGLNLIHQSDELKTTIEEICLPQEPLPGTTLLIHATLNLPRATELKDFHAKRAALSALLTHMRQGQTGSCFASFIAIALQSINPHGALLDFKQLLREGKLTRKVDNHIHDFPYLMKIEASEAGLSDSGFKSVYNYLSIPYQKSKKTDPGIDEILEDLASSYNSDKKDLEVIFASSIRHPLLSIWENSIAGMAEGVSGSMLKSALIQSIQYLVRKSAKKHGFLDLLNKYEIESKVASMVMQRSHYLYDPTLALRNLSKGAFVLYDNESWAKIDNADSFQNYLSGIVGKIFLELDSQETDPLKIALQNELSNDTFITSLLKRYHRENQSISLTKENIKILRYTPWTSSIGNDPQMVLKVYHETGDAYSIKQIKPANAEELLLLIKQTLAEIPHGRKKKYILHGKYTLPMRIRGVHIFSLLLCHPTMTPFLTESKEEPPNESLIKSLSKLHISSQIKSSITEYCHSFAEKKQFKKMDEKLATLPKKYPTAQLRAFLIEMLTPYKPPLYRKEDLIHEIDLKILDFLPKTIRKEWEKSIIHFADTNWQSEIEDIHYGIGLNPGTGKIELLSVLGNGKIHKFLDQDQFLRGKTWELYLES